MSNTRRSPGANSLQGSIYPSSKHDLGSLEAWSHALLPNEQSKMASQRSEGRVFTFVDYDINHRGVTEKARAHLMKDRVRSKREARSEWVSRNHFSPLRWMRPKEDSHQPNSSTPNAKSSDADESEEATNPPVLHYATIIDFQRDSVTTSPFVRKPRSRSPRPRTGTRAVSRRKLDMHDNSSESSSSDKRDGRSPTESSRVEISSFNSPFLDADSPTSNASVFDGELVASRQRRTSVESRSEFGLSLLEGLRIATTPPPQRPIEQNTDPE